MSLTNYAEDLFLMHIFVSAQTAPSAWYLAFHKADPTEFGTGTECSGGGYARTAITFAAASGRTITQTGDVDFPSASGSWGTITHYSIWDAQTVGNMLAYGALSTSKSVTTGNQPTVADGQVVITVNSGGCSTYLATIMLDWLFRNQAYSKPNTYLALCTVTVVDADTGSTITEPTVSSTTNYDRVEVTDWENVSSGGINITNDFDIVFGPPLDAWGNIIDLAIADAATVGNLLIYSNAAFDEFPDNGDVVQFAAGALDITLG